MLTYEDCLALSGLTEEEIEAICEHEHVPEIIATEIGRYLLKREDGVICLSRIILDDIKAAERKGDLKHAEHLQNVLAHFVATHPSRSRNS